MNKYTIQALVIILFALLYVQAYAGCVQLDNKVGLVGLDSVNATVYAAVTDHNDACGCNQIRFLSSNTDTKMALSILLSAKMSGKSVRIDISDPANCDTGYRVYVQ